jgi:hypothetical protein
VIGSARIGTNASSAMYWDDTNNRLGIGTSSPARALSVIGNISSSSGILAPSIASEGSTLLFAGDTSRAITSSSAPDGFAINIQTSGSGQTRTSGTLGSFSTTHTFAPTSGTSTYSGLNLANTINQTGGANGITRGLYVNPTLTAAADWRSIEWSNNSGWGLYGAGTAPNYLGGRLNINTASANSVWTLNVEGIVNISRATGNPSLSFNNTASAGTSIAYLEATATTLSIYAHTSRTITFAAGAASGPQMTLTAAGRLLLGTTTESTFLLDVNGTARVSTSLIAAGATSASSGSIAFLSTSTATGTHAAAIGYNASASASHGIAIGYNSLASANPSYAFGYDAQASGQYSTAFSKGRASGNNSIAGGNNSVAVADYSVCFGNQSRSYLNGQFAISSGNMSYNGDSQYSIYTGNLNTNAVSSGGTYSFAGVRPSNSTFGSGVSQIWFVEAKIVFAVKGKNTSVTEFNLDDIYTCVYRLAVKSNSGTGTSIVGTPTLSIAFNDTSMATTSVSFSIVSNNLVANVTPPIWASAGQVIFRGTLSYELTELGNYAQIF